MSEVVSEGVGTRTGLTITGGPVDYFAILGVGNKLVWKHTQKKCYEDSSNDNESSSVNKSDENDEELERFGREIVYISIVALSSSPLVNENETNKNAINSSSKITDHNNNQIPITASYMSASSSHSHTLHHDITTSSAIGASSTWNSTTIDTVGDLLHQQTLLISPCPSDATTIIQHTTTKHESMISNLQSNAVLHIPTSYGWYRIYKTLPTLKGGYGFINQMQSQSFASTGKNTDDRTTNNNVQGCPLLWKKNDVLVANLDFVNGIRGDVQSRQLDSEQQISSNILPSQSTTNTSNTTIILDGVEGKTGTNTSRPPVGGGFRRKMQSTLQNFQQQLLPSSNHSRNTDDELPLSEAGPTMHQSVTSTSNNPLKHKFFCLEYKRRSSLSTENNNTNNSSSINTLCDIPAIADVQLCYVRLHWESIPSLLLQDQSDEIRNQSTTRVQTPIGESSQPTSPAPSSAASTNSLPLAGLANQLLERYQKRRPSDYQQQELNAPLEVNNTGKSADDTDESESDRHGRLVPLEDFIQLPPDFDEWSIPSDYRWIRDPHQTKIVITRKQKASKSKHHRSGSFQRKTIILDNPHNYHDKNEMLSKDSNEGFEIVRAVSPTLSTGSAASPPINTTLAGESITIGADQLLPRLWTHEKDKDGVLEDHYRKSQVPYLDDADDDPSFFQQQYFFVPILAIRRQRVTDDERFHEDPAVVDLAVSFCDRDAEPVWPDDNVADDDENNEIVEDEAPFRLLGKTRWLSSFSVAGPLSDGQPTSPQLHLSVQKRNVLGMPLLLVRKNLPFGFADAAFATSVLGRFPFKNYKGLPLPEEELPMFCYPTGCRLHRTRYRDAPLPQYYGFVVKNERGDSIHVSCVSFFEPLTASKVKQLNRMSEDKKRVSIAHRRFCERNDKKKKQREGKEAAGQVRQPDGEVDTTLSTEADNNFLLTGFDDMTTFENKTICLISRYPFWTAYRKFLSHLHLIAGTPCDVPLERWISHLLLSVPLPRPGGTNILVPLTALNEPMVLCLPPEKDLPLVDLPYQRLFACLGISTVITIVLGLLALERKVIVLSTRPSLVLDVCELLKSLLFPFDLCAPYVPRLTEPFKTSLDFPGALFVGIHDDGAPHGLAATVRASIPEDGIIIDLDTGGVECDGEFAEVWLKSWNIIPESSRLALVTELEALCHDANILDGQEPLDSLVDSAFVVSLAAVVDPYYESKHNPLVHGHNTPGEPLDDRAVRDAFLRFFCAVLGGYERFLVVPDADFLVSGNEWFDSKGFLASVHPSKTAYLSVLVSTQLFQSFVQRRTEASDVHCLLFDECLVEFHSSPTPYGRLGGDVESIRQGGDENTQLLYSLLVDQAAALPSSSDQTVILANKSMDTSEADSSFSFAASKASLCYTDISSLKYSEFAFNASGDLVTAPSKQGLTSSQKFVYFVDGNPCFPHSFVREYLLPMEPESWLLEMLKATNPLLARSERELEEASRRRKIATFRRGLQSNRRCLWQLPKLMGSHVLGAWLLCTPALVSQKGISHELQSKYLLRALGALRQLRSKQRIVPDEAAYRALMVACGRSQSDRRVELVKLFGLLRSDGIFPSAVTLGQYTRALAEGYSKRSSVATQDEESIGVEVTDSGSRVGRVSSIGMLRNADFVSYLSALDPSLASLEAQGKRWRQKNVSNDTKRKRDTNWCPVTVSSSLAHQTPASPKESVDVRLLAIWSRTRGCSKCNYIPLEEEVQAGWDVASGHAELPDAVACPRCGFMLVPMLGYREFTLSEALQLESKEDYESNSVADFTDLPPQINTFMNNAKDLGPGLSYVTYVSPATLRSSLEQYVETFGEEILQRNRFMDMDPEALINLWWYCARFALPLPIPTRDDNVSYYALAAWDRSSVERGCCSAAKVISRLLDTKNEFMENGSTAEDRVSCKESYDDCPLLSRFNLQGFYSTVWDHIDLSQLLVALVDACDKRDFKGVVEAVIRCNTRRREYFSVRSGKTGAIVTTSTSTLQPNATTPVDLDAYRTILYLARYQCTTAFHAFFPSTVKPCKGYHFWCAIGTPQPMFDRLLRDGLLRYQKSHKAKDTIPIRPVSEVALGFRCVFGHLI